MSYSFVASTPTAPADIDAFVEAQAAGEGNVQVAAEEGHIEAIKAALAILVPALARDGDQVTFSVSGHANPGGDPNPGWASNYVSISITQVYGE